MKSFNEKLDAQRDRILAKLDKTEPGSTEYKELQTQLERFDEITEKRNSGKITPSDWLKFGGTMLSTGLLVTADQWFPAVASKLRISEFIKKAIHR